MHPAPCWGHTILSGSGYHHFYFVSETNKPADKTYSLRRLADPDYKKKPGFSPRKTTDKFISTLTVRSGKAILPKVQKVVRKRRRIQN